MASKLVVSNAVSEKSRSKAALAPFYTFRRHSHAGLCHVFAERFVWTVVPTHGSLRPTETNPDSGVWGEIVHLGSDSTLSSAFLSEAKQLSSEAAAFLSPAEGPRMFLCVPKCATQR